MTGFPPSCINPLPRSTQRSMTLTTIMPSSTSRLNCSLTDFRNSQLRFQSKLETCGADKISWNDNKLLEGVHRRRRRRKVIKCEPETSQGHVAVPEMKIPIDKVAERHKVVGLVSLVMGLCSVDRVVMSVAVVPLGVKYAWSSSFIGIVQSSFLWGYIVSSVIGGALADRYGGKKVMSWGVAFWSLFTLLTPWAADHSATTLLAVRALFGLSQGATMPSMNLLLSRCFPTDKCARAVGISMAGFQLGNVVGLCLTPIIMSQMGISGPFVLFSSMGLLIWSITSVYELFNKPELQLISQGDPSVGNSKIPPTGLLISKRPYLAIILANSTNNWGYFVLLSWMPMYFKTVLNVDLNRASWFSAVPWGVMAVSSCIAGALSDYLIKAGYPLILVRKIMQSIGCIGPGLSLLCLSYAKTPGLASVILTVALSLSSFCQAGYFLNIKDIAPESAGLLHGISNAIGTVVAMVGIMGTGYFVEWLGSFKAFLTLTSMLYFLTTVYYNLYATEERVF